MTPSGIEPATFRFVAQHLSHCVTAVPAARSTNIEFYSQKIPLSFPLEMVQTGLLYNNPTVRYKFLFLGI